MTVTLTFWNRWVTPRVEHYADGTHTAFFGIGKVTWQRKARSFDIEQVSPSGGRAR